MHSCTGSLEVFYWCFKFIVLRGLRRGSQEHRNNCSVSVWRAVF